MADIKENQMPEGTPVKVRALDAKGNSILVALNSGLFHFKGNVYDDFDSYTSVGIYKIVSASQSAANCPSGIPYGLLLVFGAGIGEYAVQVAMEVRPNVTPVAKFRTTSGAGWSVWRSITLT